MPLSPISSSLRRVFPVPLIRTVVVTSGVCEIDTWVIQVNCPISRFVITSAHSSLLYKGTFPGLGMKVWVYLGVLFSLPQRVQIGRQENGFAVLSCCCYCAGRLLALVRAQVHRLSTSQVLPPPLWPHLPFGGADACMEKNSNAIRRKIIWTILFIFLKRYASPCLLSL